MALVGYARVSTVEQSLGLQKDALAKAGCEEVFEDQASGTKPERPGLGEALGYVRRGDTLVVWKLDRLGRSMAHLIETMRRLEAKGGGFRSLTEGVDTTTPGGTLVFHIFGALAQFERDLIRKRTRAGLKAAETRDRKDGRRPVVTPEKLERARRLLAQGLTAREAAARLKVAKTAPLALGWEDVAATYAELLSPPARLAVVPDAIQVASALAARCSVFLTNYRRLKPTQDSPGASVSRYPDASQRS